MKSINEDNTIERIARALELLLKIKVDEIRGDKSDSQMVIALDRFGCSPSEMSRLLGVPTTTINPILSRARKSKKK